MTALCRLMFRIWSEKFAAAPILKKTSAGAAACLNIFIFSSPWQGPHFSMLSPNLGRAVLSPHPFIKKRPPVPRPTGHILIIYWCGRRHTFPVWWKSHVENWRNLGKRAPLKSNFSSKVIMEILVIPQIGPNRIMEILVVWSKNHGNIGSLPRMATPDHGNIGNLVKKSWKYR